MRNQDAGIIGRDLERLHECWMDPNEAPMSAAHAEESLIIHLKCQLKACPRKMAAAKIMGHDEPTGGMAKLIEFPSAGACDP